MSMIMQGCSQGGFEGFGQTPNLNVVWGLVLLLICGKQKSGTYSIRK